MWLPITFTTRCAVIRQRRFLVGIVVIRSTTCRAIVVSQGRPGYKCSKYFACSDEWFDRKGYSIQDQKTLGVLKLPMTWTKIKYWLLRTQWVCIGWHFFSFASSRFWCWPQEIFRRSCQLYNMQVTFRSIAVRWEILTHCQLQQHPTGIYTWLLLLSGQPPENFGSAFWRAV